MIRRTQRRQRRALGSGAVLQLCCGWDFFRAGFDDDLPAMREAWQDPAIREAVLARQRRKWPGTPPFAQFCFGDGDKGTGLTSVDLPILRREYEQAYPRKLRKQAPAAVVG